MERVHIESGVFTQTVFTVHVGGVGRSSLGYMSKGSVVIWRARILNVSGPWFSMSTIGVKEVDILPLSLRG